MYIHNSANDSQKGNVLFYILIAVALLAALSYAVASGNRSSGGGIDKERASLAASEILEYSNVVGNAVAQLRLRGVADNQLCFDSPVWGHSDYNYAGCTNDSNKVFNINGGGVQLSSIPENASVPGEDPSWRFTGANEIENVGTTCAGNNCSELIMSANFIREEVCIAINNLLGVGNENAAPPTDTDISDVNFLGTYPYQQTIADEAGGSAAAGKNAACLYQTGGTPNYFFYKVLIAR